MLLMGKSTISTEPFSSSQTLVIHSNEGIHYMVLLKYGTIKIVNPLFLNPLVITRGYLFGHGLGHDMPRHVMTCRPATDLQVDQLGEGLCQAICHSLQIVSTKKDAIFQGNPSDLGEDHEDINGYHI